MAKEAVALQYLAFANRTYNASAGDSPFEILDLTEDSYVTVTHSGLNQAVLAFWGTGLTDAAIAGGNATVPFLAPFLPSATFPEAAVNALMAVAEDKGGVNGTLMELIYSFFDAADEVPLHLVVTGDGPYGHVAQVAGAWAGLAFPMAAVDVITFGANFTGSSRASWAFDQLTQLYYLFPYNLSTVNSTFSSEGGFNKNSSEGAVEVLFQTLWDMNDLRTVAEATTLPDLPPWSVSFEHEEDNVEFLNETLGALAPATGVESQYLLASGVETDPISIFSGYPADEDGRFPSLSADGSEDTSYNKTTPPDGNYACTPLLCRARALVHASCWLFTEGQNATLLDQLPRVFVSNSDTGANAAVAWVENTMTAVLVWEGSIQKRDWTQDALAYQTDDFHPLNINGTFGDVQIHRGFYNQFKSLTQSATDDSRNITYQILELSGGRSPRRMLIAGHSLGSALASLSGVFFSTVWTNTSITVVGSGTPKVGNEEWVSEFRGTVGRAIQFEYGRDIVSAVPPWSSYHILPELMWLTRDYGFAAQRPAIELSDLTFDDHHCQLTYLPHIYDLDAITVPGYIANGTAVQNEDGDD